MEEYKPIVDVRYHVRSHNPHNKTLSVSKDIIMAQDFAKKLSEKHGWPMYVVEVREREVYSYGKS